MLAERVGGNQLAHPGEHIVMLAEREPGVEQPLLSVAPLLEQAPWT